MLLYLKFIFSLLLLQFMGPVFSPGNASLKAPTNAPNTIDFGAISDGKKVIASWSSGFERSFDYFTIERSKDGLNFVSAVMIKGAGKISTLIDYTDIDYSPFSGISYYRLKQTDYSGESFYSETVIVNFQFNKDGSIEPYANKIPDQTELKEIENKDLLVVMKDAKGKEFISKIHVTADSEHLYATDPKHILNQGTYLVVASSCNRLCSQKLIIR